MNSRVVAGRYQVGQLLGEGGMATVYRAVDLVLRRPVALKILRPQYAANPEFVERFQREARAAATLSHPNIVGVYDLGIEDNTHFIAMEYVEGETLKEIIQREAPLPAARIVRIGIQLADALEYAHSRSIVHRDVKPQNILVTPDGRIKVMDFGIAAAAGATELTRPENTLGTAAYISPEQAQGYPAGPPSDVYSAGVVLYELATGRLPFRASHPVAVARMHVEDPPPRPGALNPTLPHGLERIILRALAKDPLRRFATAGELARVLSDYEAEGAQFTQAHMPRATAGRAWQTLGPTQAEAARVSRGNSRNLWIVGIVLLLALILAVPTILSTIFGSGNPTGPPPAVSGATPIAAPSAASQATSTALAPSPASSPTPTIAPTAAAIATSTSVPAPAPVTPTAQPTTPTPTAKPASSPTAAPAPSATPAPSTTTEPARPSPTPAPRQPGPALQAALARVAQEGYNVSDPSSYDESQTLRVLIGTATGSADGYDQRAFFFLGDRYLGTDTANPSAQIVFGGEDGNVVTIVYTLYRPGDPMSKPTGGKVGIQYQWNGTRLIPLQPIPPDDPSADLSRR